MTRMSLPARLVTMTGALVLAAGCGDDTAATDPSVDTSRQQTTTIAAPTSAVTATASIVSVQGRLDEIVRTARRPAPPSGQTARGTH